MVQLSLSMPTVPAYADNADETNIQKILLEDIQIIKNEHKPFDKDIEKLYGKIWYNFQLNEARIINLAFKTINSVLNGVAANQVTPFVLNGIQVIIRALGA